MPRPEDDLQHWNWELVASATRHTRLGPRTYEAWVAPHPDGWYMIADNRATLHGPYATYDLAVSAAQAMVREDQLW